MKIGNTDFNPDTGKNMTFKFFSDKYKNLLKGSTLEEAYIKLGGKIKVKKEESKDNA